jgi:hypothetical protein
MNLNFSIRMGLLSFKLGVDTFNVVIETWGRCLIQFNKTECFDPVLLIMQDACIRT